MFTQPRILGCLRIETLQNFAPRRWFLEKKPPIGIWLAISNNQLFVPGSHLEEAPLGSTEDWKRNT
jgi:hypothetical protein